MSAAQKIRPDVQMVRMSSTQRLPDIRTRVKESAVHSKDTSISACPRCTPDEGAYTLVLDREWLMQAYDRQARQLKVLRRFKRNVMTGRKEL